jgi:hypothetical protein
MTDYDFTEDDEPDFGDEDGDEDELLLGSGDDEDLVLDEDF